MNKLARLLHLPFSFEYYRFAMVAKRLRSMVEEHTAAGIVSVSNC